MVDAISSGRALRRARQQAQKEISDIAAEMRVAPAYIEALEDGDWSKLPGNTYAKGYMRRYAEIMDIGLPSAAEQTRPAEQIFPSQVKKLAVSLRETPLIVKRALVMGAVALLLALIIWSVMYDTKQQVQLEMVKPVPQRLEHLL
jgi:cytoskeleton protein RodZ